MSHMKNIFIAILFANLAACGTVGDYYVFEENGEAKLQSTLLKDDRLFVHLKHFDGNISTLKIYQQNAEETLGFRIIKANQSLSTEYVQIPSISRDDTKSILEARPESPILLQITEVYDVDKPLERATEKVDIELLVDDEKIKISKEFSLKRVTYNQFQALMGI